MNDECCQKIKIFPWELIDPLKGMEFDDKTKTKEETPSPWPL